MTGKSETNEIRITVSNGTGVKRPQTRLSLSPPLAWRLQKCSDTLGLPVADLARQALLAAVQACEQSDYALVLPVEFQVTHVPGYRPEIDLAEFQD